MKLRLIGIIGKQNSGKDILADTFLPYGYVKIALADALKEYVHSLFNIPKNVLWGDSAARDPRTRAILQEFGTDFARKHDPSVWINHVKVKIEDHVEKQPYAKIVIPDIRFPNEAQELQSQYGALLIKVVRPDSEKGKDPKTCKHPSENVDQIPNTLLTTLIKNDTDLRTYKLKAKKIAEMYA